MSAPANIEIIQDFLAEIDDYIPSLLNGFDALENGSFNPDVLAENHRLIHTIKGASSLVGMKGLGQIASQMEQYLEEVADGKHDFTGEACQALKNTVERFREYCNGYVRGGVSSREMLKNTIVAFQQVRGQQIDPGTDEIHELLASVPEREGCQAETQSSQSDFDHTLSLSGSEEESEKSFIYGKKGESVDGMTEDLHSADEVPLQSSINLSPELLQSFYDEAEEHLEDFSRSLSVLESNIQDTTDISSDMKEEIRRMRRCVHTLKGAAAVIGFHDFSSHAHKFEDLLDWLYEKASVIDPSMVVLLAESSDLLNRLMQEPQEVHSDKAKGLRERYLSILREKDHGGEKTQFNELALPEEDAPSVITDDLDHLLPAEDRINEPEATEAVDKTSLGDAGIQSAGSSNLRFHRTLRVDTKRFDDLVNLSGELIIALSSFDQQMESFSGAVADLELYRERLKEIARDLEVSYEVRALERLNVLPEIAEEDAQGLPVDFDDFDSLELDRYSELNLIIRKLNESAVDVGTLHTQLSHLYSDFEGRLNRQRVVLSELQDKFMQARMTPFAIITERLRRTVREVSANLDKQVFLKITGEDIELDKLIWEKIADPLMHLLRNAVDHGIEPTDVRKSLGKTEDAVISLTASREGNRVVLRITDDGGGLDYAAIRSEVHKRGLSDRAMEMSKEDVSEFIFYPGFSTRADISEISGRGMGMDVVKETIINLNGGIHISSEKGTGTQFTIQIPLTLAAVKSLLFTAGGRLYAVALNEINEVVRIDSQNIVGPEQDALRLGKEVLPLFRMSELLKAANVKTLPESKTRHPLTLVINIDGKRGALMVDRLVGQKEIVIKSLGSHLRNVKGVAGATIMGDGSVVPIVNLGELLWSSGVMKPVKLEPGVSAASRSNLTVMVVDDSVSIRQVVSRLLESRGWNVLTAKDGLEAFERLGERLPDLIILDIEMPRMNGYEFLSAARTQVELKNIPIVMLTSRSAAKHREKARALGADGFVIKPYNDNQLINLIQKLTNR